MKVKLTEKKQFTPISVEITLETELEAASFQSLFNHGVIATYLEANGFKSEFLRSVLSKYYSKSKFKQLNDALQEYNYE